MISIMDEIDGLSISKPVDIVKLKLSATSLINYWSWMVMIDI